MAKERNNKVTGSWIDEQINSKVWLEASPIVSVGNVHTAYLTSEIVEPEEYSKLVQLLTMVPEDHTVILLLNTPGGRVDSGMMIVDAIKHCKAKVIGKISGDVASVGTIITMVCDEIIVSDHCHFMIHAWSGGIGGKTQEVKAYAEFADTELTKSFGELYNGFLSKKEMKKVMNGTDMWMNKNEVLKRWDDKMKVEAE